MRGPLGLSLLYFQVYFQVYFPTGCGKFESFKRWSRSPASFEFFLNSTTLKTQTRIANRDTLVKTLDSGSLSLPFVFPKSDMRGPRLFLNLEHVPRRSLLPSVRKWSENSAKIVRKFRENSHGREWRCGPRWRFGAWVQACVPVKARSDRGPLYRLLNEEEPLQEKKSEEDHAPKLTLCWTNRSVTRTPLETGSKHE